MPSTAFIALDHSAASEVLVSCVADLSDWGVDAFVFAHVIPLGYAEGAGYGNEVGYQEWLDTLAAPLRAQGKSVTAWVGGSGVPAAALVEAAVAGGAELIVAGSRSHNLAHRVFLGSFASELLQRSTLPVLIERIEPTAAATTELCELVCFKTLERVLLATDASACSHGAEVFAERLALRAGHIDVLTVVESDIEADESRMAAHATEVAQRFAAAGAEVAVRSVHGDATEQIVQLAGEGYSLVVVGKHGRNWAEHKLIGTTAAKVSALTSLPVLVVPLKSA